jgi:hypothetical protein
MRSAERCIGRQASAFLGGVAAVASVALAAGGARLFAAEFMRVPALVGCAATQAGDFPLSLRVHRGKATQAPALWRWPAAGFLGGGVF